MKDILLPFLYLAIFFLALWLIDKPRREEGDLAGKTIPNTTGNKDIDLHEYEKERNKAAYEARKKHQAELDEKYFKAKARRKAEAEERELKRIQAEREKKHQAELDKKYPEKGGLTPEEISKKYVFNYDGTLTPRDFGDINSGSLAAGYTEYSETDAERKEKEENYKKYLVRETNQERIDRKRDAEMVYERNKLNRERAENFTNYGISETNAERKKRTEEELTLKRNRMKGWLDEEKKKIKEEEAIKKAERISNERLEQKINLKLYGKNATNAELVHSGFLKKIWSPKEKEYIYDPNLKYEDYKKHTKEEINKYWENVIKNEPKVLFWDEYDKNKLNPCPERCKSKAKETKWLYKNLKQAILESHRQQEPYYCPSGFGYHIRSVKI